MALPVIGVDISDASLKYMEFERSGFHGGALEVKQWGDIVIPEGIIDRGQVQDPAKLADVLREMRKRTKAQYVSVALPEEHAYLFETVVDMDTPHKDIRGLIEFRLEENVPLSPRDAYFDYAIVDTDKEAHAYRVVVAVYAQATINSYYEACVAAGLMPLSFEIEAQAIARATVPNRHPGTYMIVDFGKTRMGMGVVYNGALMYTSTVDISGRQMSEDVQRVLGEMDESAVIEIKNAKGILLTPDNLEVGQILRKHAEDIARELAVCAHYWHTRGIDREERAIQKVILCGGSANLHGLPEFLSQKLEIPTERAQVWTNAFDINTYVPDIPRSASYRYATAIGLALRNCF